MSSSVSLPAGMFWHIFRKDWRLLWPLAVGGAVFQALLAAIVHHSEPFTMSDGRSGLAFFVTLGLAVSITLLIVLIIQQDAIPGVSQDWLVRPIRRGDLLLSKVVAVALLIHGPIMAVNLLQGLSEGFSFGEMLRATLQTNFEVALLYSLPVMALAAVTRSVGEAVIVALAMLLGLLLARVLILAFLFPFTRTFELSEPTDGTGLVWIGRSLSHLVLLSTTIAVLVVQYFRRGTFESRALLAGGFLLFMLVPAISWSPAFAIQHWFAARPDASRPVTIVPEPQSSRSGLLRDSQLLVQDEDEAGKASAVRIVLPLRISGVPAGVILHADRAAVRLVGANGQTLYRGVGHTLDSAGDAGGLVHQVFDVPAAIYAKAADQAGRLEVDYSLTLFRSETLPPLPALNADRRLPQFGWCASRVDAKGTGLQVGCRQAGALPFCVSMTLEQAASGRRNPEKFVCELNYEPAVLRFSIDDVIDHVQADLPFRDPASKAPFAIGEAQLRDSQVVIRVYEPEDHFSRRVTVSPFRMSDWRASASEPAAPAAPD